MEAAPPLQEAGAGRFLHAKDLLQRNLATVSIPPMKPAQGARVSSGRRRRGALLERGLAATAGLGSENE